jgi:predicted transcriptional regulator|tara:strand:- start:149 stop:439 length:291 start_codon:yes stop_codon:yes gene_type:complete
MSNFYFNRKSHKQDIIKFSKAIGSNTRFEILKLLKETKEEYSITSLANKLKQTEANISSQIKTLEKVGLITTTYKPGNHGVSKMVSCNFDKLVIEF